jgi:hypothetical protein
MGAGATCNTARAIPYTINGQTVSLPPQVTYTQQPRRLHETTLDWLSTPERKSMRRTAMKHAIRSCMGTRERSG